MITARPKNETGGMKGATLRTETQDVKRNA